VKLNIYQIAKAIEANAATAVDMRMLLKPEESREQAEGFVKQAIEFNKMMAEERGDTTAIEQTALIEGTDGLLPDDAKQAQPKLPKPSATDEGQEPQQ